MSSKGDICEKKNKDGSISQEQVHSANSWETADLGDRQRNEKFLRLMGASKKEHLGKIVIGDKKPAHKRPRKEEKHLAEDLEEQYEHSMEHRLVGGRKGHLGLGYHPADSTESKDQDKQEFVEELGVEAKGEEESEEDIAPNEAVADTKDNDDDSLSRTDRRNSTQKEGQRKRESFDKESTESDGKKMKFVKSNK